MTASTTDSAHGLVGESQRMQAVRRLIEKAARNRLPVLLLGESGTGKEVVARAIFRAAPQGQFVPIDCGSLVRNLMETELFGHTKGAFTGAAQEKKGLVELAHGGTLFFDEIGDLPLEMQVKLLRLLQEGEYRPVGGLHWKKVSLRVIAATHRDLKRAVLEGRFRMDLFYRLNVFPIKLPPLRERKQDIPALIDHFLSEAAGETNPFRPVQEMLELLSEYDWPGNVRELKHCVERMAAMHSEGVVHMADMPSALQNFRASNGLDHLSEAISPDAELPRFRMALPSPVITIRESQKQAIFAALAATNGERTKAAGILRISRATLYRRMKEYGME